MDLYEPTTTTSPDQSTKDDMSIHQGCDDEPAVNKCSDDTVVKMDNDSNGINSSQHDNDHKVATTANSDSIEIVDNNTNGHNESNINGHDTNTEENDVKDDDIHQQDLNGHFIDDETDASDIIFQAQIILF